MKKKENENEFHKGYDCSRETKSVEWMMTLEWIQHDVAKTFSLDFLTIPDGI